MKIGIGQMNSRDDRQANLNSAADLVDRLAREGAQLILLPEYFNYLDADERMGAAAEPLSGPSLDRMRAKARQHGVHLLIGTFLEAQGRDVFDTAVVLDPQGRDIAVYRKMHLFDIDAPVYARESDFLRPGNEPATVTIHGITFGLAICYDLRFPELFRHYVAAGVQALLVPAAFTLQTGRDHWEVLLRARAVENLCWVAAAGQWGAHPPGRQCYGHSMVVDPWGLVRARAGDGVGTVTAEIDRATVERMRRDLPALDHRRKDVL